MRPPTKVANLTSAGGGTAQIQMTCVVVSSFLSTLLRGRQEQRHFALAEKLLTSRLRLVFLSRGRRRVPPPISSVLSCNHDSFIRTPRSSGRLPTKHSVSVFPPQNDSGSPAQRPAQLRVRPVFAQHQIQPRGQFPRHCHVGESAMFARRQAMVDRGNVVITSSESGSTGRISEQKLGMNPIHRGLMAISGW